MVHTDRALHKEGGVRASFFFACEDPKKLGLSEVEDILQRIFSAFPRQALTERFTQFVALVEDRGKDPNPEVHYTSQELALPGRVAWVKEHVVKAVLNEKHNHETPHRREAGTVSRKAPRFLKEDTCVVVVGTRPYLCLHAHLYLERVGVLRGRLIEILTEISGLEPASRARKSDWTFVEAIIREQSFYAGNFDALAEAAGLSRKKMSTAQMLERISS